MKVLFEDTKIIRDFEGFSLKAYPDPATGGDPWTIAWGITGKDIVKGVVWTQQQCEERFMYLIDEFCGKLDKVLKVNLLKNKYMACLSLAWNIGMGNFSNSTLLKKINIKDMTAADEFLRWDKANGKVMAGLTKRREKERELFLS